MIQIFTDTSANLPFAVTQERNITVVPFSYTVDGVQAHYPTDTEFDGKAFYGAMLAGAMVKTSMVSVGAFLERFEPALAAGNDVLYVGMSGGISGTANSAAIAVDELREKYPERRLAAIDTYAASLGEGLQVLDAARMADAGVEFDEIVAYLERERHRMCQYFTVADLEYLKRNGRLSGVVALAGTLLNIKPILMGDETGHIIQCGKVRGTQRALEKLADKYDELAADRTADIGIAHADNPQGAETLLAKLRALGFRGNCMTVMYEPVTGSHVGPGTVALFYPGVHK